MRTATFWLLGTVAAILVGSRLTIAVIGGGELASEGPIYLLDVVILAVVVLVVAYFGVQAAIYAPWHGLSKRVRDFSPNATVLSSAIEPDQFEFFRSNGFRQGVGPWPFHAAIALRRNSLEVWRRSSGQDTKVAKVHSQDFAVSVVHVHWPTGVFPALDVATANGSLRLYPMRVSRWWRTQRLTELELEEIVLQLPED